MDLGVGMCFDRSLPAAFVIEVAESLDAAGVDQLWVIEDCFFTAGVSLAAAALARTTELTVGLGILPAVARNPAITAMELATLANLAPGRVIAGIGHGVQEWMAQMGARTSSPLTTLEEAITIVRRLLHGDTVTFDGVEFTMDGVALEAPPTTVPPVVAGVGGPRSLELAGRVADGVVLAGGPGPTYVAQSIARAGREDPFRVSVFAALAIDDDARTARRTMAPFVAELIETKSPAPTAHPHIDEIRERFAARGVDGIADMPADWWIELGAIGTFDDAVRHAEALAAAGADDVAFFPGPTVDLTREDLEHVTRLAHALR
ncbi:MAG TPA: LLM class flavin-dependent oxidoreductase [Ilumatobacteraceae bacterium]|nr:LLM class flavin-dependent oxidoreductase [Ilumatobacteraceae bacterium]